MPSIEHLALLPPAPGVQVHLAVHRYGTPGRGPKAYLQAALHADEVPALLVAQRLAAHLAALEAADQIAGEVVLVPAANPIGLAQRLNGLHHGRFDLRDGANFNRGYAELADAAAARLAGRLGADPQANVQAVRAALAAVAQALPATHPAQDLKRRLLQLAIDADVVLDLHCDGEAVMHLYALAAQSADAQALGALLGAQAVLLADESGDSPFDEACSRPWLQLRTRFADAGPLPLACFATTVELRGECDTDHGLADRDALALIEFLRRRGVVAGTPVPLPAAACEATPLAGSEPVEAPHAGVVVYRAEVGARVQAGQPIADLVDVASGATTTLVAHTEGVFYARAATRWAAPGQRLGKIAGRTPMRSGKLLSP
jgi:predicted deacylase